MTRTVGILLFDEVEVLDACGPFEVFSVANRMVRRRGPDVELPFEVFCISVSPNLVAIARGGLRIGADYDLSTAPVPDIALVPGGLTDAIERDGAVLDWVKRCAEGSERVASVCTGAFVLAEAGLLRDRDVTTHWEDQADLQRRFPDLVVRDGVRFVDHGAIATSAGVSAGIDLSLHIVRQLEGEDVARATARQMDYPYTI